MWVKRSEDELAEYIKLETKSEGRLILAVVGLIGLTFAVTYAYGWIFTRTFVLAGADHSFSGKRFVIGLINMAVMLILTRVFFWKSSFDDSITACSSCSASSRGDAGQPCQCGGSFAKLSTMKWVEDLSTPPKP